jgi:hypothetical protein
MIFDSNSFLLGSWDQGGADSVPLWATSSESADCCSPRSTFEAPWFCSRADCTSSSSMWHDGACLFLFNVLDLWQRIWMQRSNLSAYERDAIVARLGADGHLAAQRVQSVFGQSRTSSFKSFVQSILKVSKGYIVAYRNMEWLPRLKIGTGTICITHYMAWKPDIPCSIMLGYVALYCRIWKCERCRVLSNPRRHFHPNPSVSCEYFEYLLNFWLLPGDLTQMGNSLAPQQEMCWWKPRVAMAYKRLQHLATYI